MSKNDNIMLEFIRLLIEIDRGSCNMSNDALKASSIAGTILQLLELQGITCDNIAEQGCIINGVITPSSTARHGTII